MLNRGHHKARFKAHQNFSFSPHSTFNGDTNILLVRRAPAPKAWSSTINPITQKNASQPQQNGIVMQQKPVVPAKAGVPKENITSDKHAHDRLTFILAASTVC
jgi:hypothetical protein